jgi:hypothetical protein
MAASQLTMDQKLDLMLQKITAVEDKQSNIEKLVNRVTELENTVHDQSEVIKKLTSEVTLLKDKVNTFEQIQRGNAVRLFGFPGSNDETNLSGRVYDRILKPILAAAKAKGDIATVPQINNVVEDVFRAGKFAAGANKPPPPVIIKFTAAATRLAVLKNKRTSMPSPTEGEKSQGIKRFGIAEDLTSPTYRKLQDLQKDERVNRAWTINGEIWFVLEGENMRHKKVKCIFDSVDKILS